MPWATAIAAPTTGDAAAQVAANGDPTEAAIASERAASLHGLTVIAADVGDHPEAYTRFVSIGNFVRLDRERQGVANGVLVRHRPSARGAASRDRAVRPSPHRPPAARLAPDPADAVALPLRRRARGASRSTRSCGRRCRRSVRTPGSSACSARTLRRSANERARRRPDGERASRRDRRGGSRDPRRRQRADRAGREDPQLQGRRRSPVRRPRPRARAHRGARRRRTPARSPPTGCASSTRTCSTSRSARSAGTARARAPSSPPARATAPRTRRCRSRAGACGRSSRGRSRRHVRTNGSISNATTRPAGSTIVWDSRSTVRSAPSPTAAISAFTSSAGRVTGTSPTWTAFEKKMSPNDGAITTSKP